MTFAPKLGHGRSFVDAAAPLADANRRFHGDRIATVRGGDRDVEVRR